ncbi:ATP-binding protein [Anaerolineales bacterium HSG24]|nr:ATP-binding protein [Anaerolineales bacterium HSG24]
MKPFQSLQIQLLIAFVATVLLTATVIGVNSIYASYQKGQQYVVNQLESAAVLKEKQIEQWHYNLQKELALLVSRGVVAEHLRVLLQSTAPSDETLQVSIRQDLDQVLSLTKRFDHIALLDLHGTVLVSTDPAEEGKNYQTHGYIRRALKDPIVLPPRYYQYDYKAIAVAHPVIRQTDDEALGILVGFTGLQNLNDIMLERTGLGKTGETYLVDLDYELLTDSRFPNFPISETLIRTEGITQTVGERKNGIGFYDNYRNIPVVGVYHWLPELRIALLAEQEQAEAFQPIYDTTLTNTAIVLGTVFVVMLLSLWVSRWIANPIGKLAETAERISDGDLALTVKIERQDEIGVLADAFNSMTTQLLNLINNLEDRVEQRTRAIESSAEIGRQMTSMLDIEKLLQYVVNRVKDEYDYYHVQLYLVDEETGDLIMARGFGEIGQQLKERQHRIAVGQGIVGTVATIKRYFLSNNVNEMPNFVRNPLLSDTKSELAVPLRHGEKVIGVLDIQSRQIQRFSSNDISVMQLISDQLAVVLDNARLYSQTQRVNAKLARLNQDKDKFFSIVAHDLKGPFMPLLGNAELLAEMGDSFSPTEVKEMGSSIYRSAQSTLNLLEALLTWARMQMGRMTFQLEEVLLSTLAQRTVDILTPTAKSKGLTLTHTISDAIIVYGDDNMIETVIRNLTNNALKFTLPDGEVTISVQPMFFDNPAEQANISEKIDMNVTELAEVSVIDTGVGISPEDQAKLFRIDTHHSTFGTDHERGTGLGLIICQEMIERHGGRIWVESEEGVGTTFKFTLPIVKG